MIFIRCYYKISNNFTNLAKFKKMSRPKYLILEQKFLRYCIEEHAHIYALHKYVHVSRNQENSKCSQIQIKTQKLNDIKTGPIKVVVQFLSSIVIG